MSKVLIPVRQEHQEAYGCDPEEPVAFVGVYAKERHYGGSEEGGWWYVRITHVTSVKVRGFQEDHAAEVARVERFLRDQYGSGFEYRYEFVVGDREYRESSTYE